MGSCCRVSGLVVDGAEHLAVAVPAAGVVPGLDPVEDRHGELVACVPAVLVEQLELKAAEEALGDAVCRVFVVPAAEHP